MKNLTSLDVMVLALYPYTRRNSTSNGKSLGNHTRDESIDLWKRQNFPKQWGRYFIYRKKRDIMLNSANSREKLLQSSYRWLKIKTSIMTIIPDLMIMKIHYWQLTWNPRSLTPIGSDDSKKSWEDEPVFALHKEQPVDFVMNSRPIFRPYVKVILQLSQHKQITLTALIDTRAVSSIIRERCLPKSYHVPTQVSFTAVSRYQFYSHKYAKLI